MHEQEPRRPCGRHRDMNANAAGGRLALKLVHNDARRAEKPLEAAHVDGDEIVAVALVARRELLGNLDKRMGAISAVRRSRVKEARVSGRGR